MRGGAPHDADLVPKLLLQASFASSCLGMRDSRRPLQTILKQPLVPKLLLGNAKTREGSILQESKLELCDGLRSQAGAWERVEREELELGTRRAGVGNEKSGAWEREMELGNEEELGDEKKGRVGLAHQDLGLAVGEAHPTDHLWVTPGEDAFFPAGPGKGISCRCDWPTAPAALLRFPQPGYPWSLLATKCSILSRHPGARLVNWTP